MGDHPTDAPPGIYGVRNSRSGLFVVMASADETAAPTDVRATGPEHERRAAFVRSLAEQGLNVTEVFQRMKAPPRAAKGWIALVEITEDGTERWLDRRGSDIEARRYYRDRRALIQGASRAAARNRELLVSLGLRDPDPRDRARKKRPFLQVR